MNSFLLVIALALLPGACATSPLTFPTPEAAVQALVDAGEDANLAEDLLGEGGFDMLRSGDDVDDHDDIEAVRAMIKEKIAFEDNGPDRKVALLGNAGWKLPIPLVRDDGRWSFDVEAGKDQILTNRIGRNELSTIATLHAIVAAQREYVTEGRDGRPPAYARRLLSTAGKHDGLYWPVAEGEPESPMGPLVAQATSEGYEISAAPAQPVPYHGYYYRVLTAQGANASGGARSYVDDKGQLTGGFAVLAWPANWQNSGVVTFLVNQHGIVFQKDLGSETARVAATIQTYDPDLSWTPTRD